MKVANQSLHRSPYAPVTRHARASRAPAAGAGELNRYVPFHQVIICGTLQDKVEVSPMSTAKEELTRLIQQQPEDSSREELIRELAFHAMVARGLSDSDAKRSISNEEMGRRIRLWQQ